ncbi:MAG TPA: lysine-sensitive aspartokinase 3 [Gemmatimonadaceae bacterium]|nr:lysine-sensitive aspartokinase 3 [Gemmatimonadaceae bacterium]
MIVCKFGGTSVADAAAIRRAAEIVRGRAERRPIVVVSALAGVTNALLAIAEQASGGQLIKALSGVDELRERHLTESRALLGEGAPDVEGAVTAHFTELAALATALNTLGHVTPRSYDAIAAIGERCASLIVVSAFRKLGLDAVHIDARDVVKTDATFMRAEPKTDEIAAASRYLIAPHVRAKRIPVMGGFVGSTDTGITTTLGRGGGDYSAALIGAAIPAEAIEIWTDVDGMLTADPRVVSNARLIEEIRFEEASELASFGAKVLHPSTIAPAVKLGIPVFIFNSRRPEGKGTRITFDAPRRAVTAIAGKQGVTMLRVRSTRMLMAHGFLSEIFDTFERHRTSVDVVATSEVSVSLTVDDASHLDDLVHDLSKLGDVSIERNRGIVALVGADLGASSPSMARALSALGDIRVHMLSLSATGINLTLLVDGEAVSEAMRRLHGAFFE